jgi:hypothetical protein
MNKLSSIRKYLIDKRRLLSLIALLVLTLSTQTKGEAAPEKFRTTIFFEAHYRVDVNLQGESGENEEYCLGHFQQFLMPGLISIIGIHHPQEVPTYHNFLSRKPIILIRCFRI